MIELRDIVLTYGKGAAATSALKGINLTIERGEFIAIVGKSGCGKSSLLSILAGIQKPSTGEYLFDEDNIYRITDGQRAKFRNKKIGFIVQNYALLNELTVQENVLLPMRYTRPKPKNMSEHARISLESVGMETKINKYPFELSGGENQRVAIARALVNNPDVILADEPTGALDEENGRKIMDIFSDLHRDGNTIVIVTHDMEVASRAQRIIEMKDGEIVRKIAGRNGD